MSNIYEYSVIDNKGNQVKLETYKGKALLIVNTASKCGFTPQYRELEELYRNYKAQGLEILAFPCNQFGAQEPGTDEEIKQFCDLQFNITFPLFSKIDVKGKNIDPLYKYLTESVPGLLGSKAVKWNFTKFLVNKDGLPVDRYAPSTAVKDLEPKIKELLEEK